MDTLALFRTEQQGGEQFEVRALVVDGEPWFKGNDVAACLEYTRAHKAVYDHVDPDDKQTLQSLMSQGGPETGPPSNQQPHEVFINESGVYALIFRSSLGSNLIIFDISSQKIRPPFAKPLRKSYSQKSVSNKSNF